jgi:hypothetical protein
VKRLSLMRRAVRLFNSEYVSREQNKRQPHRLAERAIQMLGDRWVLKQPVPKGGA